MKEAVHAMRRGLFLLAALSLADALLAQDAPTVRLIVDGQSMLRAVAFRLVR